MKYLKDNNIYVWQVTYEIVDKYNFAFGSILQVLFTQGVNKCSHRSFAAPSSF